MQWNFGTKRTGKWSEQSSASLSAPADGVGRGAMGKHRPGSNAAGRNTHETKPDLLPQGRAEAAWILGCSYDAFGV